MFAREKAVLHAAHDGQVNVRHERVWIACVGREERLR